MQNLTAAVSQTDLPGKQGFFIADIVSLIYLNLTAINKKLDALYNLVNHSTDCQTAERLYSIDEERTSLLFPGEIKVTPDGNLKTLSTSHFSDAPIIFYNQLI